MAENPLALTVEDLGDVKTRKQSAKAILSEKVTMHRVDNGLQGVQDLVEKGSSYLGLTNRRHSEILQDMTSQVSRLENKYRTSNLLNKKRQTNSIQINILLIIYYK